MINTVAIVGVGLIGGSFGLSLRKVGFAGEILGVSSPGATSAGLRAGAISSSGTLAEAAARADVLYLAQPIDRILVTIERLGGLLAKQRRSAGVLVTDAGSTKAAIVAKAKAALPAHSFLGGHPMAGKEKSGVEVSDADLFVGRPYVLTPSPGFDNPLAEEFRGWIGRTGARLVEMTPEEHDAVVALTSHLPQLISTTLALTLAAHPNPYIAQVHGSGLLDMTRLAMSSADLWESIISTNQSDILHALDDFSERLRMVRKAVLAGDISTSFVEARTLSSELRRLSS
ncbi:MAG: prephenate dehydrogenase/arogenate dehydrogenase family protein [Bryobacteraceae bacterium]